MGNASVGFGSTAGNSGYPLSITDKLATSDTADVLDGDSLVHAVSDIYLNGDAFLYSPATASLVTDLTNPTTLSGPASSCVAFDQKTIYCKPEGLTPIGLKTNRGDFKLFESYTVDDIGGGAGVFSANWGVFLVRAWTGEGRGGRGVRRMKPDGDVRLRTSGFGHGVFSKRSAWDSWAFLLFTDERH